MSRDLPPYAIALKQRHENQNVPPVQAPINQYNQEYDNEFPINPQKDFTDDTYDDMPSESQQRPKKRGRSKKKAIPQDMMEVDYQAEIEDYKNLILDLQKKNGDLEKQNADLTAENAKLQTVQQDLIKERQISDEYFKQIDELKDTLRDEQVKSKCLSEQVTQLESIVQSKNQQIDAKESMIHSINIAYNQMVSEYQASALLVGTMTGQIRQYTKQISELETQIAELRSSQRSQALNKRYESCYESPNYPPNFANDFKIDQNNDPLRLNTTNADLGGNSIDPLLPNQDNLNNFNTPQNDFNDYNNFNNPNSFNDFYREQNDFNDYNAGNQNYNDFNANNQNYNDFNANNQNYNDFNSNNQNYNNIPQDQSYLPNDQVNLPPESKIPQSNTPIKKTALVDNIFFGDSREASFSNNNNNNNNFEFDLQTMSAQEMKEMLTKLQKERDEAERILNKAPPKGKLLAHVNREKEEKEKELENIVKQISKIKYRLKVIKAL